MPGFSTCDGGIVIDLGPMKGVMVDPGARTVRAQGGVTWGQLDRESQQFGLATTGGVMSTTGIAGLTLGGGRGWLMRKYGLASDNLVAADIVCADGRFIRADADEHPELFWGLRGGGGNFGIAAALSYRLHEVGPVVAGGSIFYDAPAADATIRCFRDLTAQAPDDLSMQAALVEGPAGPASALAACYAGTVEDGERLLDPARRMATPLADALGSLPYVMLQSALDEAFPSGRLYYTTSRALDDLSDEVIALIVEQWRAAPRDPVPWVVVEHMGGAVAAVPPDGTAYGNRDARYEVSVWAGWTDPNRTDEYMAWGRGLARELDRHSRASGYINYIDDAGEDAVRAAYGDRYARLQALKDRYDPDNVFRLNQNIKPAKG